MVHLHSLVWLCRPSSLSYTHQYIGRRCHVCRPKIAVGDDGVGSDGQAGAGGEQKADGKGAESGREQTQQSTMKSGKVSLGVKGHGGAVQRPGMANILSAVALWWVGWYHSFPGDQAHAGTNGQGATAHHRGAAAAAGAGRTMVKSAGRRRGRGGGEPPWRGPASLTSCPRGPRRRRLPVACPAPWGPGCRQPWSGSTRCRGEGRTGGVGCGALRRQKWEARKCTLACARALGEPAHRAESSRWLRHPTGEGCLPPPRARRPPEVLAPLLRLLLQLALDPLVPAGPGGMGGQRGVC